MTQKDMLAAMGISLNDFQLYLAAYNTFFNGLTTQAQKDFHLRNNGTTLGNIAKSLGPSATPADVQQLFDGAVQPAPAGAAPAAGAAAQPANMVASVSCCRNG